MLRSLTAEQRHVVLACYLGWTLDAFDFFIMVFVFRDVAKEFGTGVTMVTTAVVLTLMMRALGAFLFGRLADRYGRRPALMASILGYSVLGFASGLAPSFTAFLVIRALFGIAMGGEWGIGASLTMESIPARMRGPISGILQAGYPSGYLLASILYGLCYAWAGWRGMFMLGALPALLVFYIRRKVDESPDWARFERQEGRLPIMHVLRQNVPLTIYTIVLMTCFNFYSHGTQDLYPHFLQTQHHITGKTLSAIVIAYNLGAIVGGFAFGSLSQKIGRRRAIAAAALLSLLALYPWAFVTTPVAFAVAAFCMQFCVQGAWGVIPAHLNELSPPAIRGTFPGVTYQLGNFIAASNLWLQSSLGDRLNGDYRWSLVAVAGTAAVLIAILITLGREASDTRMGVEREAASTPA